MKRLMLVAAMLFASAPAGAQSVEVAEGDWSQIPYISATGSRTMSADTADRLAELLRPGGQCSRGEGKIIDMTIPFMLEFEPKGGVKRIVVRRMGCPQLETIMAGVVKQLALAGQYRPTGENDAHWYRSEISFSIQ